MIFRKSSDFQQVAAEDYRPPKASSPHSLNPVLILYLRIFRGNEMRENQGAYSRPRGHAPDFLRRCVVAENGFL